MHAFLRERFFRSLMTLRIHGLALWRYFVWCEGALVWADVLFFHLVHYQSICAEQMLRFLP